MRAILFTAQWCGPCHQMEPITAEVFEKLGDYYNLERVDVDRNPELAMRWVVRGLPTILLLEGDRERGRLIGLQTRSRLLRWLEDQQWEGSLAVVRGPLRWLQGLMAPKCQIGWPIQEEFSRYRQDRVWFDSKSSKLSEESLGVLELQYGWLLDHGTPYLLLEGHCDDQGSREDNLLLGETRAKSVYEWFQLRGYPSSRLASVSYGKERPCTFTQNTEAERRLNRRVVTVIRGL